MSEQSLAANTSVAVPATKTRLHWRKIVAYADLPAEATALITTVIKRARLWRSEAREVAIELVAHFQDGMAAGRAASELTTTFGDPKQAARLIRRGKARCRPLWWQAWWWCSRGLLVLLAVYLLLVLWQLWAKPEVKVNYLEIINKPALAVPEPDRAWPYYRDAFVRMKLHTDMQDSHNPEHQRLKNLFVENWRPGNEEWPALVAWLEQHRAELDMVRQGASKPAYGFPVWNDYRLFDAQDRLALRMGNERAPAKSEDWEKLYATILPHVEINQQLAKILSSDAIRAAKAGDAATALADIEALLGLGQQSEETPFLIGGLVALSIDSTALQTAAEILYTQPQLWSAAQLQQLAHRLAGQHFHPESWLQGERYSFLDIVQRIYSDDGRGDGRMTLAGLKSISELSGLINRGRDRLISPEDGNVEKSALALALPGLNMVAASRKEMTERYQQLMDRELALLQQPYWQSKNQPDEFSKIQHDSVERLRYFLILYLFPHVSYMRDAVTSHQGRLDGLLIGIALELYHREHGKWPDTLKQLSPRYLPTLPVDHLTGKPLQYRLIDGKPCVYSVGDNLQDDGGQIAGQGAEEKLRNGFYDRGLNDGVNELLDWILWSLVPEHQRSLPPEPEKLEEDHEVESLPALGDDQSEKSSNSGAGPHRVINTVQRQRIDSHIAMVASEDLEQSIENLATDELFCYPGYHSPHKMPQVSLEIMFSNRRCLKIISEIEKLDSAERDAKCKYIFDKLLKIHKEAYHKGLKHNEDPSSPPNSQSLFASNLGICTAMFVAAEFASPNILAEEFQQLDDFAQQMEKKIRQNSYPPNLLLVIRGYCSPDNRFKLNVLYLLARRLGNNQMLSQIDAECKLASLGKISLSIVPWNAEITWFDISRSMEGIPLDVSKGVTNYVAFEDWTEGPLFLNVEAQRQLVSNVHRIVYP